MRGRIVSCVGTLVVLVAVASTAVAEISLDFTQRASAKIQATADGCTNHPGPYITLNGELKLSGVKARVILTNNRKFTHVATGDIFADVVLIPAGETIRINKQPSRGGVGGNPWIYLQFNNCKGGNYGGLQLLGRCVQGLSAGNIDFPLPTKARAKARSGACSNSPGPYITLDGDLLLGGLCAQLVLTNNAKFTHATSADVVVDVQLVPEQTIVFHKQPPLGGAGGNPLIYIQFLNGSGGEISSPIFIGRCNQI